MQTTGVAKKGEIEYDRPLFDLLRRKRKELAEAAHVPPYVIFSDRTLVEMAAYYPLSPGSMLRIYGLGKVKFEHYGKIFLALIGEYCQEHGLAEKARPAISPAPTIGDTGGKPRYVEVSEAYNAGETVQQLVERYRVQPVTILDHLSKYAQEGQALRSADELLEWLKLSSGERETALQAFAELGAERLKPVFDWLNGRVSYDDLKVLRIYFLSSQAQAK